MEITPNDFISDFQNKESHSNIVDSNIVDVWTFYKFLLDKETFPLNWEDLIINVSFYNNKSSSESFLTYLRSSCVLRSIDGNEIVEDEVMFDILDDGTIKIVPLNVEARFGFLNDKILEKALKSWCRIFTESNADFDLNYRHGSFSITINNEMAFMKHYPFILKINTILPMCNSWMYSFTEKRLSDQIKKCFPEGIVDVELRIYNDKIRISNNPVPLTEEEIAIAMSEK